ncbi:helix-turn-helix transcriptional regulator [Nonomuraea sp. K274]|uniref:Helix-turn-helix transcriptional regulator n=1 Tax=Nonomuraea cypriaca TaxID=1187855 RepID=A0A931F087_9ACTN|nr:XRE family transcriptional regulator [Nonomuraea cypriaca]MBF8190639.1 helix-turn-helix transcriptional regulator [Nonomuraea cypriaca]
MKPKSEPGSKDALVAVGAELRRTRRGAGLSLRELATRSGLSPSFLSLVERGECSLSLTSLFAIADALDVAPATLLGAEVAATAQPKEYSLWCGTSAAATGHVVVGEREYFHFHPGFDGRRLDSMVVRIHPTSVMAPLSVHEGEEVAYILSGELHLRIRGDELTLRTGDAVHFPSTVPHTMANHTDTVTEALWVRTHPAPAH